MTDAAVLIDRRTPRWRAWLLLVPMVAWLVLFVVLPSAILLVYSFCERDEVGMSRRPCICGSSNTWNRGSEDGR